ncbi:MAG TPA: endonuclease/exonuclease/phosphatase family protein [Acidimicrobiales bacterium]
MAEGVLRVAQLNAGSLLEPHWDERRQAIVAWLEHLAPDVVCLQEIWQDASGANTAGWIVDQMPDAGWHWRFGGAPFDASVWPDPEMRFGSAILSRWPIDDHAYHRLPVVAGIDPFVEHVPWELLHARTAGLDVFSTHLAPAPEHGLHRARQVLAIDDHIHDVRGDLDTVVPFGPVREAMPPILCGDFNAEPDSDEIRFLCSLAPLDGRTTGYQDAWRVAGDGPGYTQDWRTNPIAAAMNVHRKRIDYVFVGDPFLRRGGAGRVVEAELAFDASLTGGVCSDHTGLVVDILWPQRPADQRS